MLDPLMPERSKHLNESGMRYGFDAVTNDTCKGK
jgi:hypothetical protein